MRLAIIAAIVGWAGIASADTAPSVWERARDPEVGDAFAVHTQAAARLASINPDRTDDGSFVSPAIALNNEALLRGAIAMLQSAGAETSKSPLLRFDLARAYGLLGQYLSIPGSFERASKLYKSFIADFPDNVQADEAWDGLADACAHTAERACELTAWREVLLRETEPAARLTPTLNLAEVEMHEGDLKSSIDDYREAFALAARVPSEHGMEISILSEYGLAVALDRAGENNEAEHHAALAYSMENQMKVLHGPGTYFVPDYEINWYDAVTAAARARVATNVAGRLALWQDAVDASTRYVKAGEKAHDKWLAIAKARLASYTVERDKAAKAVKSMRKPASTDEPVDLSPAPLGPAPQVHNPGPTIIHL